MLARVVPAADLVTQDWGCTDNAGEWSALWCAGGHYHAGIDLGSTAGGWSIYRTPVYSPRSGVVVKMQDPPHTFTINGVTKTEPYLGWNAICVLCDDGTFLEFGHLDQAWVFPGQRVNPGQVIGLLGTDGASTAPHLHLEARADGPYQGVANDAANVRDPRPYLNWVDAPIPVSEDDESMVIYKEIEPGETASFPGCFNGELPDGKSHSVWVSLSTDIDFGNGECEVDFFTVDGSGAQARGSQTVKPSVYSPAIATAAPWGWGLQGDFTLVLKNKGQQKVIAAIKRENF